MIAVDTEYIAETAVGGPVPETRPNVKKTYCEIMQIGAAKLNESGKEIDTLNLTVKPSFIYHIPEWLSRMTGMSEAKRETGISFEEALAKLNEFIGEEKSVWTFSGDWHVFTNSAKKHNLVLPFAKFQLVKPRLAGWGITKDSFTTMGFKEVCSGDLHKVLGLTLPGEGTTTHDATYDARSLAHSIYYLLKNKARGRDHILPQ